jgi:hypothetical protein
MASPNADVEGSLSCLSLNEEDGYIPFEIIAVTHEIGQGNFGRVMKADYNGTDVAVKEVRNESGLALYECMRPNSLL